MFSIDEQARKKNRRTHPSTVKTSPTICGWYIQAIKMVIFHGDVRFLPIGSMVLLYMLTWIPSIYPSHVSNIWGILMVNFSRYTSTMDPSWAIGFTTSGNCQHRVKKLIATSLKNASVIYPLSAEIWLVVYLPLKNGGVRQLGVWFPHIYIIICI